MKFLAWVGLAALVIIAGFFWLPSLVMPYLFLPKNNHPDKNTIQYEIVVTDLKVPWDIVFLPKDEILIPERRGTIYYRKSNGNEERILIDTAQVYESGLLGLVLHPQFNKNHWLYLYVTNKENGKIVNNVFRYRFEQGRLLEQKTIVKHIPGAPYHDGGRMAFGPDGHLYITTGDAEKEILAQDTSSLAGKILRVKEDGSIPEDNPFQNAVWSYGHRNPQGITWDTEGKLWSTEHGPSGMQSGHDELNLIVKGGNYGWPLIRGNESREGLISPVLQSGAEDTWAPASALYWDGSVFFTGLRGEALYEAHVEYDQIQLKRHLFNKFGRLRALAMGPDGYFYLTTSNTDGRGFPHEGDDKVIRINPAQFRQ